LEALVELRVVEEAEPKAYRLLTENKALREADEMIAEGSSACVGGSGNNVSGATIFPPGTTDEKVRRSERDDLSILERMKPRI
jgi:hypothetical protein